MIGDLVLVAVFVYLARRERNNVYGSVPLMFAVTIGIALAGIFASIYLMPRGWHLSLVSVLVAQYAWVAIGYGVYKLIARSRENAFEKAMYDDPDNGVQHDPDGELP